MKRFVCGAVFLFSAMLGAFAQSSLQPLAVVKLNGFETVTVKDVKDRVDVYQRQANRTLTPEERSQILESIIDQKLVVQAAHKEGLSLRDSDVEQYFLQNMSQQIGRPFTEKELADFIRQQTNMSLDEFLKSQVGMGTVEYKAYLKNQLIAQQYVLKQKQSELQSVVATDKEIRDFYQLNKASFVWNDMLRMFLVSVPKGNDAGAASKKIASLMADYKAGKLTADKMRVQARNPEVAGYQAGDLLISKTEQHAMQLGIGYDRLLKIFDEKMNVVSEVKETDRDYQFYVILEKYSAKMLDISDVIQPGSNVTVYEYIKQNVTQQKQSQAMIMAVQDITSKLNTPANVERKKTGKDLEKLLSW